MLLLDFALPHARHTDLTHFSRMTVLSFQTQIIVQVGGVPILSFDKVKAHRAINSETEFVCEQSSHPFGRSRLRRVSLVRLARPSWENGSATHFPLCRDSLHENLNIARIREWGTLSWNPF